MSAKPAAFVLTILSRHIGKGHGHAICGTPTDGYYIAATAEELNATCEFLHNRAMHSLTLESKLRKIPLSDLIGQLHLPT